MYHETRGQRSSAGDRRLTNLYWSMSVAFILDGGATRASNRARHATAQLELAVGGVDDRVDLLLHQIAGDDHDSRLRNSHTSAIRASRSLGVALAMPRTPIDSMVSDAHATPHTSAS